MSRPTDIKKRPNLSFFGLEKAKPGNPGADQCASDLKTALLKNKAMAGQNNLEPPPPAARAPLQGPVNLLPQLSLVLFHDGSNLPDDPLLDRLGVHLEANG